MSGLGSVAPDVYRRARTVADEILYDQGRRVGVLLPRDWSAHNLPLDTGVDGTTESWFARTEVVAECAPGATLAIRLRFLQPQRRTVERYLDGTGFVPTSRLDVDGGWAIATAEESIRHERDLTVDLDEVRRAPVEARFEAVGVTELEVARDATGAVRGRIRRTCKPLQLRVQVAATDAGLVVPMVRLRVVVENVTDGVPADAPPVVAAAHSTVGTHCLLALSDGGFVSLLDPPAWAIDAVRECTNIHAFPVLAGDGGREDLVVSAPVLLPDHPHGAPGTYGDELDAAGSAPSQAKLLPTPLTSATYPIGPSPATVAPVASAASAQWVVLRKASR